MILRLAGLAAASCAGERKPLATAAPASAAVWRKRRRVVGGVTEFMARDVEEPGALAKTFLGAKPVPQSGTCVSNPSRAEQPDCEHPAPGGQRLEPRAGADGRIVKHLPNQTKALNMTLSRSIV